MSVDDGDGKNIPSAGDVLSQVQTDASESNFLQQMLQQKFNSDAAQAEADWTHLKGLRDHYWHKGNWSWFLMLLLAAMIGFQSYLLYKVGIGSWDFSQYNWLIPALLVQNLGQVIALAVIVVKSLFR